MRRKGTTKSLSSVDHETCTSPKFILNYSSTLHSFMSSEPKNQSEPLVNENCSCSQSDPREKLNIKGVVHRKICGIAGSFCGRVIA